jgi:predicted HTH domain antitoxin
MKRSMQSLDVYTARDLRDRSDELLKHSAEGHIGVITESGKPSVLTIPFDEHLLRHGIHRALALNLVRSGQLSLARAARLAEMDLSSFIELLGASGIDAVDYPPEEIGQELENALAAGHRR